MISSAIHDRKERNMKTIKSGALLVSLMILLLMVSCSKESSVRQLEEQNKALIRRIHSAISNGNLEIFDEVLAPDYVRHCQAMPPGLQEIRDTAVFKAFVADFVNAVSDCKDEIDFIIADSNMEDSIEN